MDGRSKYMIIRLLTCIVCGILLCIALFGINSMRTSESEAIAGQEERKEGVTVLPEKQDETDKAGNESPSDETVSASGMAGTSLNT